MGMLIQHTKQRGRYLICSCRSHHMTTEPLVQDYLVKGTLGRGGHMLPEYLAQGRPCLQLLPNHFFAITFFPPFCYAHFLSFSYATVSPSAMLIFHGNVNPGFNYAPPCVLLWSATCACSTFTYIYMCVTFSINFDGEPVWCPAILYLVTNKVVSL